MTSQRAQNLRYVGELKAAARYMGHYVLRWGVDHPLRDGTPCACPVGALCHAFSLTPASMEQLLGELERAGRIRRVPDALGAWDMRCL